MRNKIINLLLLFLMWAPHTWAQNCSPNPNNPGLTQASTILLPNEVNGLTATVTAETYNTGGETPSHNLVVTPGTQIVFSYGTSHAVSGQFAFIANGTIYPWPWSGTGGTQTWTAQQTDVGYAYTFAYTAMDQNGNSTQDRINVSIVAGSSPSLIFQDDFPTNYYLQFGENFSGASTMGGPYCPPPPDALHYPYIAASITNPTSGETKSFGDTVGNDFCPNCDFSVSGTPLYISFLPGDAPPKTTTTGKLKCTVASWFFLMTQSNGDKSQNQRVDKKMWTKVKAVQQAGDGGWYTQDWCIQTEPPIWSPNEIYSELLPLYLYYWTAQTCSSSPPGTDPGPGWHCPGVSGGPGKLNPEKFFPSHTGVKGSCNTNVNTPAPY